MPTASPADQRQLLTLQAHDTHLRQLAHRQSTLPELAELAQLDAQLQDLTATLIQSQTAVRDLNRELAKAESDVEQVRSRASRDQARLQGAGVSPKDAQALMAELESLARRQAVLEDIELEVMERLEAHQTALAQVQKAVDDLTEVRDAVATRRDIQVAELDAQAAEITAERSRVASEIDGALVALYERIRDARGGQGVVAFRGQVIEGLNVALSLAERADIAQAPPDQIIRLEEYGHIVVRLDESN